MQFVYLTTLLHSLLSPVVTDSMDGDVLQLEKLENFSRSLLTFWPFSILYP